MTNRAHRALTDGEAATLIHGVETEYAVAGIDCNGQRLDPRRCVSAIFEEVTALVPHLHCGTGYDVFTANGSRVYIDAGLHPEVASAECSSPEEVVIFTRAGDHLLANAARAVERAWPEKGVEIVLWKGNVDHRTGAVWGSHESFLHQAPQTLLASQLITHLVTRIIYTGAGGFNNRSPHLEFVISPRAFHLEHEVSASSTRNRGIFHTRDEPLAGGRYRRAHVLCGESLWSETSDYLRVGATALLVAQVDAGRRPQCGVELAAPLEALATIARDVHCRAPIALRTGEHLTAIAVQRRLLENVEADLGAPHLPAWAAALCERWRQVLDGLERSPSSLIGVLDWPTKLAVLERQSKARGARLPLSLHSSNSAKPNAARTAVLDDVDPAVAAKLLEMDMRFNRLDRQGIFASLDAQGTLAHRIVSPQAIERAVREPPATGRARIRGAWVRRLSGKGGAVTCTWQRIIDRHRRQVLVLDDPFQCEGERWSPLVESPGRPRERLDPSALPIRDALTRSAPREALRHMHSALTRSPPVSHSVTRYFVSALSQFVPSVPVPILRWGVTTARPALDALFERAAGQGDWPLEKRAGTMLYRFHEARGDYDLAKEVIARMLERSSTQHDTAEAALLTNNYAYEHLLAGEWSAAKPLFERAIVLFERLGRVDEVPSVRANLLQCRFGQLPREGWMALAPTLLQVNRTLVEHNDWRARKTLMLLARLAHSRGRRAAAIAWTQQALAACNSVPTQLKRWDRAFLETLIAEARTC